MDKLYLTYKPMKYISLLSTIILIMLFSCSEDNYSSKSDIPEDFNSLTRPYFVYNNEMNQYVLEPWNYKSPHNHNRNYPLVIFLHGSGGAGNIVFVSNAVKAGFIIGLKNEKNVEIFGGSEKDVLDQHFTDIGIFSAEEMPQLMKELLGRN